MSENSTFQEEPEDMTDEGHDHAIDILESGGTLHGEQKDNLATTLESSGGEVIDSLLSAHETNEQDHDERQAHFDTLTAGMSLEDIADSPVVLALGMVADHHVHGLEHAEDDNAEFFAEQRMRNMHHSQMLLHALEAKALHKATEERHHSHAHHAAHAHDHVLERIQHNLENGLDLFSFDTIGVDDFGIDNFDDFDFGLDLGLDFDDTGMFSDFDDFELGDFSLNLNDFSLLDGLDETLMSIDPTMLPDDMLMSVDPLSLVPDIVDTTLMSINASIEEHLAQQSIDPSQLSVQNGFDISLEEIAEQASLAVPEALSSTIDDLIAEAKESPILQSIDPSQGFDLSPEGIAEQMSQATPEALMSTIDDITEVIEESPILQSIDPSQRLEISPEEIATQAAQATPETLMSTVDSFIKENTVQESTEPLQAVEAGIEEILASIPVENDISTSIFIPPLLALNEPTMAAPTQEDVQAPTEDSLQNQSMFLSNPIPEQPQTSQFLTVPPEPNVSAELNMSLAEPMASSTAPTVSTPDMGA